MVYPLKWLQQILLLIKSHARKYVFRMQGVKLTIGKLIHLLIQQFQVCWILLKRCLICISNIKINECLGILSNFKMGFFLMLINSIFCYNSFRGTMHVACTKPVQIFSHRFNGCKFTSQYILKTNIEVWKMYFQSQSETH